MYKIKVDQGNWSKITRRRIKATEHTRFIVTVNSISNSCVHNAFSSVGVTVDT